jgi:lipid-binding SYLF domain-containing protein
VRPINRVAILMVLFVCTALPAFAGSAAEIEREARAALERLYATSSAAKRLGGGARGILVFPKVSKGGFIFAGQYGEGVLFKGGKVAGYYSLAEVSYGFQAGVKQFSYAMFFMDSDALSYLDRSEGFEIGAGRV